MGFELYLIAVMAALVYYLSSVVPFLRQVWRSTVAMKRFPMEKCHWFLGHLGVHDGPTHTGFLQLNDWEQHIASHVCQSKKLYNRLLVQGLASMFLIKGIND